MKNVPVRRLCLDASHVDCLCLGVIVSWCPCSVLISVCARLYFDQIKVKIMNVVLFLIPYCETLN